MGVYSAPELFRRSDAVVGTVAGRAFRAGRLARYHRSDDDHFSHPESFRRPDARTEDAGASGIRSIRAESEYVHPFASAYLMGNDGCRLVV